MKDAGTIEISIKQQDDNGDYQLKNKYSGSSNYLPTQGSVFKASGQTSSGGVIADSMLTYESEVEYTVYLETEHYVEP